MTGTVYALADEYGSIRYVGKTTKTRVTARLADHMRIARAGVVHTYLYHWIRSLSYTPYFFIIEQQVGGDLNEAERFWIAYGRGVGWRLTNLTTGGDGTPGWRHSDMARNSIADSLRGRRFTDEHRANISHAAKTRWSNAEKTSNAN